MVKTRRQKAAAPESPRAESDDEAGAATSSGDTKEARPAGKKAKKGEPEAAAAAKKKSGSWLNLNTLATLAAVAYVGIAFTNFSRLLDPLASLPDDVWERSGRVTPLWPEDSKLSLEVAISTLAQLSPDEMRNASLYATHTTIAWRESGVALSTSSEGVKVALQLCQRGKTSGACDPKVLGKQEAGPGFLARALTGAEAPPPRTRVDLAPAAWKFVQSNRNLFLHAAVSLEGEKDARWTGLADDDSRRTQRVGTIPLVKFEPEPTGRAAAVKRKLLGDVHPALEHLGPPAPWMPRYSGVEGALCARWKPEAAVRVVAEFREWPDVMRMPGMQRLQMRLPGGRKMQTYVPPTFADEIGLTSDKYVLINDTIDSLPLSLTFEPYSFARWQLVTTMENGMLAQKESAGFSDNDIDDVRHLIADTSTWLLAVTMLASVLHLLFEFLAFKSDIEFWQKNTSLRGLSARSVVVDLFSQIVVLAFLVDQGSSLLVSIPAAGAILIQAWKVEKATGIRFDASAPYCLRYKRLEALAENEGSDPVGDDLDRETLRVDKLTTTYMGLVLAPLVLGYALKTLIYDAHLSWYSWALGAATSAVYTGGFILMTPQLALNYTLKSVSHLPWKLLCFRFVNTFIDDLFAFIIKMPMMHRVSCFRDDVVFIIYLYQRRIYKVDKNRGTSMEDEAH